MKTTTPLLEFLHWEKVDAKKIFLRQPFNGVWKEWSYSQAGSEIRRIAAGLQSLDLPDKSHVAILSKNCSHWLMADLAIMMAGHISVPIYPTLHANALHDILMHSECGVIFIGKLDNFEEQKEGIPAGIRSIVIEAYGLEAKLSWESIVARDQIVSEIHTWNQNDLLSITYTSGTTGKPKGVMHTVEAFSTVVQVAIKDLKIPERPVLFSFLPLSHIAERVGIEMLGLYSGASFTFPESVEQFSKNLVATQPTLFFAVPRIWAKFKDKVLEKIPQQRLGLLLKIPFLNSLIKSKIKKGLGLSNATHIYSGAAPISVDLLKWFESIGIHIFQAYGITEDCIYSHFNRKGANRLGTVGKKLSGLQVKIAEDGEIRLKSKGTMKGYFKEPELTGETFDPEGFIKTGDIGAYDAEGFLKITGRLKDQFKTDKGKYIAPAPIELLLLAYVGIEQACVVGTGLPQPMALVVLSESEKNKPRKEVNKDLATLLLTINQGLHSYEVLQKIIITYDWSIVNGLLTPTLKVKRNQVEKIYSSEYLRLYADSRLIIWDVEK